MTKTYLRIQCSTGIFY